MLVEYMFKLGMINEGLVKNKKIKREELKVVMNFSKKESKENKNQRRSFYLLLLFLVLMPFNDTEAVSDNQRDSFSGLIISEDVYNDPEKDLTYTITGGPRELVTVYTVTREQSMINEPLYHSSSYDYDRHCVSSNYLPLSGKINFEFAEGIDKDLLKQYEIKVRYPKVGYMENDDLEQREIGLNLTINNILRGPPLNHTVYGQPISSIDLASNLFSGIAYVGINAATLSFEYFYTDTGETVDFKSHEEGYGESAMSFNSLNGHSNTDPDKGDHPEFAKEINNREGVVSRETIIERGSRTMNFTGSDFQLTFDDIYFGTSNDFEDRLGSKDFHKASVQFPLMGPVNTFQAGTAFFNNRVWFSISSAKINAPYRHRVPVKTVQPLKQYRAGDSPTQPTGLDSGFAQRYWNDLDVSNDIESELRIPSFYRIPGHEPDKPEELAPGVPKIDDRYINKGQEFYYFINQKTINIGSDGIILPTGYRIQDRLPDGIVLADQPFTLYNLDGKPIAIDNTGQEGQSTVDITLTESQVSEINTLARQHDYYGEDFSLRVKVRAKDDLVNKELIINQASTTFTYFDSVDPSDSVEQKSNIVAVKLKTVPISFLKTDQYGRELSNAEFKIYQFDNSKKENKGKLLDTAISNNQGEVTFSEEFTPGKYVLEESKPPNGFRKMEDITLEIDRTFAVIWPSEINGVVTNVKGYNLTLWKVNEENALLPGAEFELYGGDLNQPLYASSNVNSVKGQIRFENGPLSPGQTYLLRENKAPEGYELNKDIYKIEISSDGNEAYFIYPSGAKEELDINKDIFKDGYHYEISGSKQRGILNRRSKALLEVIKRDRDSKQPLEGVGFKVFRESDDPEKALVYKTDREGKFEVPDLLLSETYYLREVSVSDDYIKLDQDIVLKYDYQTESWRVYEQESKKELTDIIWDTQNQKLSVTIFNEQKKRLPETGGKGILIPVLVSGMTIISVLFYFVLDRKREV